MLPPPAVFVGGGDAIAGGISSEINLKNGFSLLCAIGSSSSKHHEVYALCSSALIVYRLCRPCSTRDLSARSNCEQTNLSLNVRCRGHRILYGV